MKLWWCRNANVNPWLINPRLFIWGRNPFSSQVPLFRGTTTISQPRFINQGLTLFRNNFGFLMDFIMLRGCAQCVCVYVCVVRTRTFERHRASSQPWVPQQHLQRTDSRGEFHCVPLWVLLGPRFYNFWISCIMADWDQLPSTQISFQTQDLPGGRVSGDLQKLSKSSKQNRSRDFWRYLQLPLETGRFKW